MHTLITTFFFFLLTVCPLAQAQTWQQLDSLGQDLTKQQKLKEADSVLQIALKKVEAQHGKDTSYTKVAFNLGSVYHESGLNNKAETLWLEVKQINEKYFSKKHLVYVSVCNALGRSYQRQGIYDKAEQYFFESIRFYETTLDKRHIGYTTPCNNLATLYSQQGLYDKAEPLFVEVLSIRGEVLGKKAPIYALSCNNLATLYLLQGQFEKAESLFMEAMGILEVVLGNKHLSYAGTCYNLAILYREKGDYNKAEVFFLKAKDIREQVLGKSHSDYAVICNNLGILYTNQGLYDKAEPFYLEAIKIQEDILGKKHPAYASSCQNLGNSYYEQELYDKAEPLFIEAIENKYEQIVALFPSFSEEEKQAYWSSISFFYHSYANLSYLYAEQKPVIMGNLYDQTIFTKGIIFSSTQKIKNTILNSGDTLLVNQYNNWKQQRETYTKLYQLPLEEQKMQNLDLEGMKNQINDLERDLSKKSALFGQNVQTKSYKWQEVKTKLAKNEVVIEIIKSDSAYIALFLTAQTENYPAFYLFKNAQELEDKFLKYYKNCIEFRIEDTVSYNAFWKPIADKLLTLNKKGFKKIYLSPDGVFHQLSLNTLKNPKTGKFLLEEANIQLIGSSRDLIELNKKSRDLSQNYENYQAHLLGYPIYGAENGEPIKNRDRAAGFSGVQSAVGVAGSVSLLPGTKKEVENVFGLFNQKKLKVNLLLAENATEEALKNLKSPTILHVATHGFFIPEIKDSEVQDMQTAMNRNLLKNPFMRSGLLLAGCQKPNPEGEDGILTAEEVMNLTLDNTELVVMSACETGLGDIQAGEGVFGLQRAFQQAGAKSVLMSLWKVDDEATQTLMTEFYTALLKGQSKRQAFKTAQMNLKKRFPEPYYWGAFVMVGE